MLQNHVQLKYGVWLPDYSNNVEATGNIVEATFDFVEATFDFVATNGNNVEATFDTVERIVQLVAFDNVASTSLLVWTGLNYLGRPLTFCTFSYNLDLQFITTL